MKLTKNKKVVNVINLILIISLSLTIITSKKQINLEKLKELSDNRTNAGEVITTPRKILVNPESGEYAKSRDVTITVDDTATYIYNANDMLAFSNSINAGNNYRGKKVYLMADIDMSTVCSSTKGSWRPTGVAKSTSFEGTFEGNYRTISNLYINSSVYTFGALFGIVGEGGVVQNVIMKNSYIYNSCKENNCGTADLVASNYGTIKKCASVGSTIIGSQTMTTNQGGIVAYNFGSVISCYNTSTIKGIGNTSQSIYQVRVGGIIGLNNGGMVSNCYNRGNIIGQGYRVHLGGVIGITMKGIRNIHNT